MRYPPVTRLAVGPLLAATLALASSSADAPAEEPRPFLWATFGGGQDLVHAADVTGDGRADLLALTPAGLWLAASDEGQRCHAADLALPGFGADAPLAGAFGDLNGDGRTDALALTRTGGLWAALVDAKGAWREADLGRAPAAGKVQVRLADADGDGIADVYVLAEEERGVYAAFLLRSTGRLTLEPATRTGAVVPGDARLADVTGDGRADLVYTGAKGAILVREGRFREGFGEERAIEGVQGPVLATGDLDGDGRADVVVPGAFLLSRGGFSWERCEDARVRSGSGAASRDAKGEPVDPRAPPRISLAAGERARYALADQDGDGRLDLFAFAREGHGDVTVALVRAFVGARAAPGAGVGSGAGAAALERDTDGDRLFDAEERRLGTDPLSRDTDRDGLLDGWELGRFRGVRLDLLGASPLRRDLFLELSVEEGADMARVERARAQLVTLFAASPLENPDRTRGIAIHTTLSPRVARWPQDGPDRHALREMCLDPRKVGLFHWMHLAAVGGGGQANRMSDHGSCAGVFEATLPHEFGHQIGLDHGGDTGTNGVPVYPSLMNYAYNYQLEGRLDRIRYSDGALAGLTLDERALEERIPVATTRVAFLAGPPFHFRLEPRDEGRASWVDWNRSGREESEPVRANVNAASGEGYGGRELLDRVSPAPASPAARTLEAPALAVVPSSTAHAEALAVLWVPETGGGLALRLLEQDDPKAILPPARLDRARAGPEGEPVSLATLHAITAAPAGPGRLYVAGTLEVLGRTRTALLQVGRSGPAGVTVEALSLFEEEGIPAVGSRPLPDGEREAFLLWRRDDGSLLGRRCGPRDAPARPPAPAAAPPAAGSPGRATSPLAAPLVSEWAWSVPLLVTGVASSVPAALAWDDGRGELLVAVSDPGTDRMRLLRLDPRTFALRSSEPVGGPRGGDATNQRAAIVFERAPWLPPEGRVDLFVAGRYDWRDPSPHTLTHMYRCFTIGDRAWQGREGWECHQTWNEWTYTRSAVAAAWFRGRPWHAGRFHTYPFWDPQGLSGSVALGWEADGVCDTLRDHDDWALIAREGLERSLLMARVPLGRR